MLLANKVTHARYLRETAIRHQRTVKSLSPYSADQVTTRYSPEDITFLSVTFEVLFVDKCVDRLLDIRHPRHEPGLELVDRLIDQSLMLHLLPTLHDSNDRCLYHKLAILVDVLQTVRTVR